MVSEIAPAGQDDPFAESGGQDLRRWSRIQKKVHELWTRGLDLRVHCTCYQGGNGHHFERYWITLGKEIIWEVPGDFEKAACCAKIATRISLLIDEYIETPRTELLTKPFVYDRWHLTEILLAADRRLGRKSLAALARRSLSEPARRILSLRLEAA